MQIIIYGIKNCSTMKKAFDWFNTHEMAYEFFDYKKQVLSQATFEHMVTHLGLAVVINKKGTTYRNLDDDSKAVLNGQDLTQVYDIVKANQSLLKRPIIAYDGGYLAGFDEVAYGQAFLSC